MAARIFISYRTADGADKAVALARDLGRIFGDAAVFLDKQDLVGGSSWRAEIGQTIAERPVLLLLMTPQLIEAVGADGKLRIADPADPVRRELEAAMTVGAQVIPLLCDGLAAPPDASRLPEPFNRIGELTWRKLRAYDWDHDVQRLVADLQALGVARQAAPVTAVAAAAAPEEKKPPKSLPAAIALGTVVLAAGAAIWWLRAVPASAPVLAPEPVASIAADAASAPELPASAAPAAASAPPASAAPARAKAATTAGLGGRWAGRLSHGEQVTLVVTQTGSLVTLASEPVPIGTRADWAEYRAFWQERMGAELKAVMYRGEGQLIADPGVAPRIDIALKLYPSPSNGEPIDSGNLSATLSADGRTLQGTIWRNSRQADEPAVLKRKP